ncbi:MAG: 23S rRNA (uridine(2552)-2'-O)-methyltransferase RlmE [Candidatus Polarisedimenticolaceae bacterium]|nr:23S rRNA (uridine(2552)-2'-O)-methyltransferase RlmE [Candidatus Polarisedimenticolaceae bacterium]
MSKSKSSRQWLDRHVNDEYVKKAQQAGYRSRAAFKLLEIQAQDRLLKPGMCVVDLGAAPGGWSQIAKKLVGHRGQVIALDILPMEVISGVEIIEGDFREEGPLKRLHEILAERSVDLVISDMAPNVSGNTAVDQPRAIYLCELTLEFARESLKPGGVMLVKLFQGAGSDQYIKDVRSSFKKVVIRKPKASRPRSREVYLVAEGYNL